MGKKRQSYKSKKRLPPQKRKRVECEASQSAESSDDETVEQQQPMVASSSSATGDGSSHTLSSSASSEKLLKCHDVKLEKEEELTGFRFIDCELFVQFVQGLLCPECKRPLGSSRLSFVKEDRTDLASQFSFQCGCNNTVRFSSSKVVSRVFEVNRRFPLAMFSIGRHQAQGKRFLGNMNMPCSLNNSTWANHRNQIKKATETVADKSKSRAAEEARHAYEGNDITVSGDGTYQRRGFQSKNGVVTMLSVNGKQSKVLDCEVLSNHCDACKKSEKKREGAELARWKTAHEKKKGVCDKNHNGSAGAMEPAGAVNIFRRSETKHNLRYVNFLGDGDSKTYTTLKNEQLYDDVTIAKLECCGHVQKRMGRHLTNKVNELKKETFVSNGKTVKGIGGQNKLTKKAILKIQGHFGAGIRKNAGNLQKMKQDIWAIYNHRRRDHTNCGNWCPSKTGRGEPDRNAFPDFVCDAIRPVFETLTQDSLLERCLHGGSQNTNESLHNMIWERCPKTTYVGRKRLCIAVADATIVYNEGELGRLDIFSELGMEPGVWTTQCMTTLDRKRTVAGQIQACAAMQFARQRRALIAADQEVDREEYYLAGGHE
ncbi:uncharacterized protein [Littorina saxatilis]|uniref:Mutator-like transposase domain-containing protein n=1 Tax=Littorina saxatilis TaxID=31220 RepID=A0AAN9G0A5_9CAEN